MAVKYVHDIPKHVCSWKQSKQDLQRHHVCLTDYNHYYILEEIEHRDKIDYNRNISVEEDKK